MECIISSGDVTSIMHVAIHDCGSAYIKVGYKKGKSFLLSDNMLTISNMLLLAGNIPVIIEMANSITSDLITEVAINKNIKRVVCADKDKLFDLHLKNTKLEIGLIERNGHTFNYSENDDFIDFIILDFARTRHHHNRVKRYRKANPNIKIYIHGITTLENAMRCRTFKPDGIMVEKVSLIETLIKNRVFTTGMGR